MGERNNMNKKIEGRVEKDKNLEERLWNIVSQTAARLAYIWDMNSTKLFIFNLDKVLLKKLFPTMNG